MKALAVRTAVRAFFILYFDLTLWFLVCSYPEMVVYEPLRFDIMMGLRKGFKLVRGLRRQLSEGEQDRISGAIAEHLKLCLWTVTKADHRPPGPATKTWKDDAD
jgi:hypothetical protein